MGWKIVTASAAPLGGRILCAGSRGDDVRDLQQLLADAGFYFGPVDGIYGILTEEAVSLFQKTFNLRNDGVAGPELYTNLKNASLKLNRIIYTVKPKENLKTISRNFGVSRSAWLSIPGQGNPQRKIYPGM
ncbi:MAG: peptidoglycan-binding domain-containing protein, partial [Bacteroidota bacterium]